MDRILLLVLGAEGGALHLGRSARDGLMSATPGLAAVSAADAALYAAKKGGRNRTVCGKTLLEGAPAAIGAA